MYCRQCGKPVSDNQELCDECMAKQNNTNQVYQTTAQETSSVNNEHTQTNNNNAIIQHQIITIIVKILRTIIKIKRNTINIIITIMYLTQIQNKK